MHDQGNGILFALRLSTRLIAGQRFGEIGAKDGCRTPG